MSFSPVLAQHFWDAELQQAPAHLLDNSPVPQKILTITEGVGGAVDQIINDPAFTLDEIREALKQSGKDLDTIERILKVHTFSLTQGLYGNLQ